MCTFQGIRMKEVSDQVWWQGQQGCHGYALWKVIYFFFFSDKNWAEGSTFPVVPFSLTQSIDLKIPNYVSQLSANVIPPPNSERLFG